LVTQDRTQQTSSRWEQLTQTGAGTPMGALLRRYWWPIAGASEFDRPGTKPVRLLGEDLVLAPSTWDLQIDGKHDGLSDARRYA
jgi:hypothetical protein